MMISAQLRSVGGSVMVSVPKPLLETLEFSANMPVSLTIEGEKLVITRQKRRKKTLDERLAECDLTLPMCEEELAWMNTTPAGKEII